MGHSLPCLELSISRQPQIVMYKNNLTVDVRKVIIAMAKENVKKFYKELSENKQLQEKLAGIRTELKQTMDELKRINHTNQALLRQSMELLEFDLNLFRSMRQAPETANYNKSAVNTGDLLGSRGFDAKQ